MTNTMEDLITDKKVTRVIDAARDNGWSVTIEGNRATGYLKVIADHPSPADRHIARTEAAYWYDTDKQAWKVDVGYYYIKRDYGDGGLTRAETCSVKDVYETLTGPNSPRGMAEKALRDAERAARREQAAADYKAEPDSPERAALRRALISATEVTAENERLAKEYEREWHSRLIDAAFDALSEDQYVVLAKRALEWEGQVDENNHAISLEEATTRVADAALTRCVKHAKQGMSRSSSGTSNMTDDAEIHGEARFVEAFHPIYSGLASAWGRFTRDVNEAIDLKWLGRNSY